MAYRQPTSRLQKVMVQPINLIFRHLQNRTKVSVWLEGTINMRIVGTIIGFDEFMNIVLDDAEEVMLGTKCEDRKPRAVGRIMLKGDTLCLIQPLTENQLEA